MSHELTINRKGIGTETASGSVASFETDISRKIPSLKADIMPVQDLNGYDAPWPAGGGKNLLNDANTEIGTAWNGASNSARARLVIPCNPNTTYTISMSGTLSVENVYVTFSATVPASSAGTEITNNLPKVITTGADSTYIIIAFSKANITMADVQALKLQLELGSTATAYAPYSNICPITGWTGVNVTRVGKNLLPAANGYTKFGVTCTKNSDGTFSLSGTATGQVDFTILSSVIALPELLKSAGSFNLNGGVTGLNGESGNSLYVTINNGSNDRYVGNKSSSFSQFTLTQGEYIRNVFIRVARGTNTDGVVVKPMICLSSETDTTFEPYQGETYSVTFPTEAGTVYGGTVDVAKGKLVVDTELVTISGSYTWASNTQNGFTLYNFLPSAMATYAGVCNWLPILDSLSSTIPNIRIGSNNKHLYTGGIIGNIPGVTDAASWKAYLTENPLQVTRPLAEPITYDLTPTEISTLLGQNNIWADTGDVSVEYSKLIEAIEHKLTIRKAEN